MPSENNNIVKAKDVNIVKATIERLSASEERAQASRAIGASKKAVALMFNDVRMGKAINTEELGSLVSDISASISRNESALISLARLKTKDDYTYYAFSGCLWANDCFITTIEFIRGGN